MPALSTEATIRVAVVLENAGDEVAVEAGLMADVRRVEAEGLIDTGDSRRHRRVPSRWRAVHRRS